MVAGQLEFIPMRNGEILGHGLPTRPGWRRVQRDDEVEHAAPVGRHREIAPGEALPVDVRVQRHAHPPAGQCQRLAGPGGDRSYDEGRPAIAKIQRRGEGGSQPAERRGVRFARGLLLEVEVIGCDEPADRIGVDYLPMMAAEADSQVADRSDRQAPAIAEHARQHVVGQAFRLRQHFRSLSRQPTKPAVGRQAGTRAAGQSRSGRRTRVEMGSAVSAPGAS